MKINYFFKNVDEKIEKKSIKSSKDNELLSFNIDNEVIKLDTKNNILRKENSDSILLLKFSKNKKESGSYYIKELDSIFDIKTKTELIDKNNKYNVKYKMWLDDELIGDFEIKIDYLEEI